MVEPTNTASIDNELLSDRRLMGKVEQLTIDQEVLSNMPFLLGVQTARGAKGIYVPIVLTFFSASQAAINTTITPPISPDQHPRSSIKMQFLAIVSLLAAAVVANPLSFPAESFTLGGGGGASGSIPGASASVTFTVSKYVHCYENAVLEWSLTIIGSSPSQPSRFHLRSASPSHRFHRPPCRFLHSPYAFLVVSLEPR